MQALFQRTRRVAADLIQAGSAFVYPPACVHCGHDLSPSANGFCPACTDLIAPHQPDRCLRCSAPVGPHLDTTSGCIHCRTDPFAFERVVSLGVYEAALRELCIAAKHAGGHAVAAALGDLLAAREADGLREHNIDVVIPVPHHWFERLARPHLPPDVMARRLARSLRTNCDVHTLAKVKRTPQQSSLLPTERRNNLRGAFRVRQENLLRDRTVLLVDDVLTTGTTAHRATRELKSAGAKRVFVAVAARGIGRNA